MTGFTPIYGLEHPNDYEQPADSVSAITRLAVTTEAALVRVDGDAQGRTKVGRASGSYETGGVVVPYGGTAFVNIPHVVASCWGSSASASPIVVMVYNTQRTAFSMKLFDVGGGERANGSGYQITWNATEA